MAFPTDTVYGLGCDPRNPRALKKILSLKGRRMKPFPLLVASQKSANQIAMMNSRARALASQFWPGPLTIVLKPRVHFPRLLTAGRKTIAVRCPRNRVALQLIRKCGGPLTGTSANLTGRPPCTSARMVRRCLPDIDGVVDGGRTPRRIASTVVRLDSRRTTTLRKGPVTGSDIKRTLSGLDHSTIRDAREQAGRGKSFFKRSQRLV